MTDMLNIRIQARADLAFLEDWWPKLAAARLPGTSRPWRQSLLNPERRAELAARDAAERAHRDPEAPGFTAAPAHVGTLDLMVDVWVVLDELAQRIRRHIVRALPARPGPTGDLTPTMRFLAEWVAAGVPLDGRTVRLLGRLPALVTEVSVVQGMLYAGQLLLGATCPWCRGVTPKHPAGGAPTLQVEQIAAAKKANGHRPAVDAVHAVVCWNTGCAPEPAECGTWWRGHPAWPWHEWDWLAQRLLITEPADTLLAPATFWPDATVYPIHHSGRSGVDQALAVMPPRTRSTEPEPALPGQAVRFVGGPFNGQQRRFLQPASKLTVTRPDDGLRHRLDAPGAPDALAGAYSFEIVNGEPSYVWVREG